MPQPAQLSLFDDPVPPGADAGRVQAPAASAGGAPAPALPEAGTDGSPRHAPCWPVSPRANRSIVLEGVELGYELRRSRRRSLGFTVGPEGLVVNAPRWLGGPDIERGLRDKRDWVLRKLHEQAERARRLQATRIEWGDGAALPFLGETVILVLDPRACGAVLNTDAQALPGVARLTLHLGLPQDAEAARVRELVQGWLQRQALRIFEQRCAHFADRLGVQVRRVALSSATTRWGSASADGVVRLHWRLVHFGMAVIDYVVAHELAHLREMNHSPAFWDVVRSVLPGYEVARTTLREQALVDLSANP